MGTLKPHSNGPCITEQCGDCTCTLVRRWVDYYIWYSEDGHGWAAASPSPVIAVPNVTVHPSTGPSVPISYYKTWHYNYLGTLKVKLVSHCRA